MNHQQEATWRRDEVADFLYSEAALLDAWKLDEWLGLFTADATYIVPTTDRPDGDPQHELVFVNDNYERLQGRVRKLKGRMSHREAPRSRTRHMVSNIRIVSVADGDAIVEAYFAVYRFKNGSTEPYVGHYQYRLACVDGVTKIRHKRATLDLETLNAQGAVSIIL